MKIDKSLHKDIIEAYTIDLWPLREIAEVMHTSHSSINYILKKHGIDTSKHLITVSCTVCGAPIKRTRKRVRHQLNHFCNQDCYNTFLNAGNSNYVGNRHSQRIARSVVSKYFDIKDDHVVHHEDRNDFNNKPSNLKVFASQGDHIKYHHIKRDQYHNKLTTPHRERWFRTHRGFDVEPLWEGIDIDPPML